MAQEQSFPLKRKRTPKYINISTQHPDADEYTKTAISEKSSISENILIYRITTLENELKKSKDQIRKAEAKVREHRKAEETTREQLKTRDNDVHQLEIRFEVAKASLQHVNEQFEDYKNESFYSIFLREMLVVIATVLFGFGINIITSQTSASWSGWLMIAIASLLQGISFLITLLPRIRKRSQ